MFPLMMANLFYKPSPSTSIPIGPLELQQCAPHYNRLPWPSFTLPIARSLLNHLLEIALSY